MGIRVWAPGRVNLIGDHTDYTGGLALPMAIGLGMELTGDPGGSWIMVGSTQFDGMCELSLTVPDPMRVEPPWARYVAGVVAELPARDGLLGAINSDLPPGRGLASSAALEVAVALALGADSTDPLAIAQVCQRAEHRAVGVPCGIMDQLAIVAAVDNAVLRLDCQELSFEPIPLPEDVEVVVVDSGQERALVASPYAERRAECARAEVVVGPLREATSEQVEAIDDQVLQRRARHVTTENQRVDAMVAAFKDGDLRQAGELMLASHASLRDDFEVSTPRLDELVHRLRGTAGVYGARMTGAGFGGCVVALCHPYAVFDMPGSVLWRGRPAAGASRAQV
ncbi:MAG: galactokinase [Acidimicrobiales bacterium]